MKFFHALFFVASLTAAAQSPEVPHKLQFADITLTIRDDARKEIQKDVDAFTRYPTSFNVKVQRAKTYFPLIEKIFAEENVPDDMKYLVIQESALIADAVSTSNAVGFWQFKDFTAIEMGLRVDKEVDERLNIVSSSRAAARYLKKNNVFFNNWLYALQAYQMGAGGVMRSVKDSKSGTKHMDITSNTYWYVKKYLAHKIAYESFVKGKGDVQVITYQNSSKKTLSSLAQEVSIEESELKSFNKWAKTGVIPDDKTYSVIVPVKGNSDDIKFPEIPAGGAVVDASNNKIDALSKNKAEVKINGIATVLAAPGETPAKLAKRAGVDLSDFLKWNDISISTQIIPGEYYLLGRKRLRATQAYHKVSADDNLWRISQKYGVQLKKLKRYNRIQSDAQVKPGTTIWLASMKPKDSEKVPTKVEIVEVEKTETFAWDVTQAESAVTVSTPTTHIETNVEHKIDSAAPITSERPDSVENIQPVIIASHPQKSGIDSVTEITLENKKSEHVVKQGETLYAIAKQYNVTVMNLVNWNSLSLQQGIKPGQVLKLSDNQLLVKADPPAKAAENIEHEVKPSDTVYSIARKYGITIKELMEWNNKKDFTLAVGEKLKIVKE